MEIADDFVVTAPQTREPVAEGQAVLRPVHIPQTLVQVLLIATFLELAVRVALDGR